MIRAMKALLGLAQREDATTSELTPSLPAAEAELVAAREARDAAETSYRAALLTTDEAGLKQLEIARREAGMRIDRAEALVEALRERLVDAREREAEADRVANYQAARAQADDARAALVELYPKIAEELVQLLEVVARAEIEVQAANADLPRGAEPLASVEHSVRDLAAEPDEIVSEIEVERWVQVGSILPGTFDQANVYETGSGRGVIKVSGRPFSECVQVERRLFLERRISKGAVRQSVYSLAERMALPGFRFGEHAIWTPLGNLVKPGEVIRQVEALRSFQPEPATAPTRKVVTQLIPAPGAERVQELPSAPNTRAYRGPYAAGTIAEA